MSRDRIIREVIDIAGSQAVKLAVRKGGSRALGKLLTAIKRWDRVFPHIAEHFSEKALRRGKKVHSVFIKKYRNREKLEELVRQTAHHPSHPPRLGRMKNNVGEEVGQPVLNIERDFGREIGYTVKEGTTTQEPCSILRIVTDLTGNPITVYPVAKFLDETKGMLAVAVAMLAAVESAYAAEEENRDAWYRGPCSESWLSVVIPIMLDSSCLGNPTIPPRELLDHRAAEVIARVEQELGEPLDGYTRASIRDDVTAIWFHAELRPRAEPPPDLSTPLP